MAEIVAAGEGPVPNSNLVRVGASRGGVAPILERVRGFLAQPAVAKALPAVLFLGLIGIGALVWAALSSPPQRELFAGLADADKAAIADVLKASGIDYELDSGSGALSVSEGDYYNAKMLLAQQGLPKSAPSSDSMLSSLPMGASRAVEGERLRAAQEMDLARTIEAIDVVESAKVHLAVEQPSVFLRDRSSPAASVMLKLRQGRSLSDMQVRAIAQLVAASVPGLAADGVSIVDQTGRLLSGGASDPAAQASMRQIEVQQQIEGRYAEALTKLLTPLVGPGNFTAEVHADLDFTETQATRESFPKAEAAVRTEQTSWAKDPSAAPAVGIPGALSNTPPAAATAANTPDPNQAIGQPAPGATQTATTDKTSETLNRTYEIGREVSVTRNPVGTVRRLSVAVALKNPEGGKPRGKTEVAALEQLIKGAVGYDQQRGDVIAVSARSFATEEAPATSWYEASWVPMLARNLTALLVAAVLVFGVARPLLAGRKAGAEKKAEAVAEKRQQISGEISAALSTEAAGDPGRPVTLDMIEAAPSYQSRAALIRNFVRQDPARAALVVRDLIRADMPAETANG